MKKTRILMILTNLAHSDGSASFVVQTYRDIDHEKISMDVIVHGRIDDDYESLFRQNGDQVISFGPLSIKRYGRLKRVFSDVIKNKHYDVVHCNLPNMSWLYLKLAKKRGIDTRISHVHQTKYAETKSHAIRNKILFKIGKKYANVNLACSDMAGKFYFGDEPFITIYNGIDYGRFCFDEKKREEVRRQLGISDGEVLFGQVGRYSIVKNQSFTLNLFKKRKEKVVLIGGEASGEYFRSLQRQKSDNAIILSVKDNVEDYYCAMDYLLLPSLYEGLPIVALEAQATGLKCIMADTITKECDFGGSVFLPLDYEAWAANLPKKREEKRESLYDPRFDAKRQTKKLEDIYLRRPSLDI